MCAKTLGQGQPAHSKCSYYYITAGKWARISITLTLNMQSIKPSQLSRNTPAAPGRSNFVYCQVPLTRKPKLGFPEPPAPPGAFPWLWPSGQFAGQTVSPAGRLCFIPPPPPALRANGQPQLGPGGQEGGRVEARLSGGRGYRTYGVHPCKSWAGQHSGWESHVGQGSCQQGPADPEPEPGQNL